MRDYAPSLFLLRPILVLAPTQWVACGHQTWKVTDVCPVGSKK